LPIRRNPEYLEKNGVFKFFKSPHLQVFRASWLGGKRLLPRDCSKKVQKLKKLKSLKSSKT
jgi:hypothetical protein